MTADSPMYDWMKNEDNPYVLILMRGLPSAGKSYRANELADGDETLIRSADKFFGTTPEEYTANWAPEKLGAAHRQCQQQVRVAMQRRENLVIVDNTNTVMREMLPYFAMAVEYGYQVRIEEPTSEWWVKDIAPFLVDKNKHQEQLDKMCEMLATKSLDSHKVPVAAIRKMMARFLPNVTFEDLHQRLNR